MYMQRIHIPVFCNLRDPDIAFDSHLQPVLRGEWPLVWWQPHDSVQAGDNGISPGKVLKLTARTVSRKSCI